MSFPYKKNPENIKDAIISAYEEVLFDSEEFPVDMSDYEISKYFSNQEEIIELKFGQSWELRISLGFTKNPAVNIYKRSIIEAGDLTGELIIEITSYINLNDKSNDDEFINIRSIMTNEFSRILGFKQGLTREIIEAICLREINLSKAIRPLNRKYLSIRIVSIENINNTSRKGHIAYSSAYANNTKKEEIFKLINDEFNRMPDGSKITPDSLRKYSKLLG